MNTKKVVEVQKLLEEFGKLYQDFLSESVVYDGASLWSNKRCVEIRKEIMLSVAKAVGEEVMENRGYNYERDGEAITQGSHDDAYELGYDGAIKDMRKVHDKIMKELK